MTIDEASSSKATPCYLANLTSRGSDLDDSLKTMGSRLYVVRGNPVEELPRLFKDWKVTRLTFESDTEPYARKWVNIVLSA